MGAGDIWKLGMKLVENNNLPLLGSVNQRRC